MSSREKTEAVNFLLGVIAVVAALFMSSYIVGLGFTAGSQVAGGIVTITVTQEQGNE